MTTKIISVLSKKGGVGKSTIAANLSVGLQYQGKKVLLLDLDSSQNSSLLWSVERKEYGDVQPIDCLAIDFTDLGTTLQEQIDKYDIIIIDGKPNNIENTTLLVYASDYMIVPSGSSSLDTNSLVLFVEELKTLVAEKKRDKGTIEVRIQFNNLIVRTREANQIISIAQDLVYQDIDIHSTLIYQRMAYRNVYSYGLSIFDMKYVPSSDDYTKPSHEMQSLLNEVSIRLSFQNAQS